MAVAFTLYKGFLIVEYSETDVKAYRSREYYTGNIASYEAASQAPLSQVIDEAEDQGDFTDAGYYELMRELGRAEPARYEATNSKRTISIDDHALEDFVALADNAGDAELRDFLLHAPLKMTFISEFLGVRNIVIPDALYKRLLGLIDEKATIAPLPVTRSKYEKYKRYLEEYGKTY